MMIKKLLGLENKKGIYGLNKRNIELVYPYNKKIDYKKADDKVLSKKILEEHNIPCADSYAVFERTGDIKKKWKKLCHHQESVVLKPANGYGGDGISILYKNEKGVWQDGDKELNKRQIYEKINRILAGFYSRGVRDKAIAEACLTPHPFFAEIYESGVPDFRVITLKEKPIMAMLRMPTSYSDGKANLHQDGVGIGIDIEKGELREVYDGKGYSNCHPDSNNSIFGKKIPFWKEIIEISVKTAKAFPLEYLGIDIVLDKNLGPVIMEVNVRPGLDIQMVNKCGLQDAIDEKFS